MDATIRMADHQYEKLDRAEQLFKEGVKRITKNSTRKVWGTLFHSPITNAAQIVNYTGLTQQTVRLGLQELEQLGMVFGDDRKRNRKYYFYDLINIIQG